MSLLSDIQGRPERVLALLHLLEAHDGPLTKEEMRGWLQPPAFRRSGGQVTAADQTLGCARSLGFVREADDGLLLTVRPVPAESAAFGDLVHARLRDDAAEPDRVMFEAYAALVVECERQAGTSWISDTTNDRLAESLNAWLLGEDPGRESNIFNPTKYAPWRAWMTYLGLGWEIDPVGSFLPTPAVRLGRELEAIGARLSVGRELPAHEVLGAIAERMPYLDGGRVFQELARRMAWSNPTPRVTRIVSEALRDLHDDGRLRLETRGDAVGAVHLAPDDSHPIQTVLTITIRGTTA